MTQYLAVALISSRCYIATAVLLQV